MTFSQTVINAQFILTEGAITERLRRDPSILLPSSVLNTALLYTAEGPNILRHLYREYLHIGFHHDLPMVVLTPTWRANPERLAEASLPAVTEVSEEAFRLLDQVRDGYGDYSKSIFIGGLMGCRGSAYRPAGALGEREARLFHEPQANALAQAKVDFLIASTLPALAEAKGIAEVMAGTYVPYILSFLVRRSGHLLDGTPLEEAVTSIDASVDRPPVCYLLNCVHPSVFEDALEAAQGRDPGVLLRVLGLQANTSLKSPQALAVSTQLECEDPELFAARMMHLRLQFGTKIMGGCCGTDARHIYSLARKIRELLPRQATPGSQKEGGQRKSGRN
jgi:homocysteine S-methyltransferase